MRVVFDTNVLLDIALARQPFAESSLAALEKVRSGLAQPLIAPHTLATFYYIVAQAHDRNRADTAVRDLLMTVEVAHFDHETALRCCEMEIADFEDAMIVACAIECYADLILTRNESDFAHSPIPVQSPEAFCRSNPASDF